MRSKSKKAVAALALACAFGSAQAQTAAPRLSDDVVRIGLLADLSGPTSDYAGQGAIEAVKMAVADFGGKLDGKPIDFVYADHQNKVDVAVAKAREWFDTGRVDMVLNLSNSSAALAVMEVARTKKKVTMVTAAGSTRITNESCSPYNVHYVFDAYALANAPAEQVTKAGADSWYLLVADFAYGQTLEKAVIETVGAAGGKIVGTVKHPFVATEFSSQALQAIASNAKAIGLANSSTDTTNSIKALKEFGIKPGQTVVAFTILLNEIHGLGLESAQGLQFADAFYWDRNDESRAWSRRFFDRVKRMPNMVNAGDYSATLSYLKAVKAAGSDDPDAVMAKMRELPINDVFAKNGRVREDGRMVHDMYLVEVKKPSESKYAWDYLRVKSTIPAEKAFMPLSKSTCALVTKRG